ncbi:HDOD domain-containing protein [Abyssibacter sp.]|uniref:HDOD domain-containing protein n=1 Tax=Abyssibacter sp. TaxID=2320200 RepID=UPI0025BCE0AC|nr:HDOD domain-containing protein [Abyssibacter sp.]MCK5859428.1 HDOD domain-containing protein [Abyssibacter sp.]
MSAEQLLTHVNKLPTVPKVVHELMSSFQQEDVETARIAGLIETDPVISAKVLRLANSAYFHRSRSIGCIGDAVLHLGFERVRNLVVGCGLVGSMQTPPGMDKPTFWRHAIFTAVASRELARLGQASTSGEAVEPEMAFAAGIIYPVGELLMRWAQPLDLFQLDTGEPFCTPARAAAEREAMGFDFASTSALLAEHWQFPTELVDGLRAAGDPDHTEPFSALGAIVAVGSVLAAASVIRMDPPVNGHTLDRVGIRIDQVWNLPPINELSNGLETMLLES